MSDNLLQFFGRLHPLIVHLPIGVILLAIVLQWFLRKPKYTHLLEILPFLWFAGFITSVLACLAGFMLKAGGGYDDDAVNVHQYLGIGLAVLSGIIFIIQSRRISHKFLTPAVLLAALLLFGTGHFGGNLTHGDDYLTQPLYAIIGKAPNQKVRKPITNVNEAEVYSDLIEPVLEQKCYQCHNGKKQKGDLRLDDPANILKGGEHGKIITAGKPDKSDLYKRLVLPEGDDDRMPPKGKPQLSEQEIELIHWWIAQGGADFQKKVAEIPQDAKIKTVLASLASGKASETVVAEVSEIPRDKVKAPAPAALQKLRALGVVLSPLTKDNTYLALNMVNAPHFSDADMALLTPLKDNIIWLDMSETAVTDRGLSVLNNFKYLTRLSLDQTAISDAGLVHLKTLTNLKYLNLYGTKVSDMGLKLVASCKSLKSIYLWQTKVTPKGVAALQKRVGNDVEVNFGMDTL